MGLDQLAFAEFVNENGETERNEIAYWRKVNWLQGWMNDLYVEKGGTEQFNCESVYLTEDDLVRLEQDIINNKIAPREGFFYGVQEISDDSKQYTLSFIADALNAVRLGDKVYYYSWW